MADWIKMRTDLYRDPKVCIIADFLADQAGEFARHTNQIFQRDMTVTRNALRNVTVGALVTVWGIFRHRGKRKGDDLFVKNSSLAVIDDICETPGFGAAMAEVEWVKQTKDGLVFPNFFEEFNVDPVQIAKEKNVLRQRRHREKNNVTRNVTVTSQSNVRGEESREEKSREECPQGGGEKLPLVQTWFHFNKGGKPVGVDEISAMIEELRRHGITDAEIEVEIKSPSRVRGEWPSKFRDRLIAARKKSGDENVVDFDSILRARAEAAIRARDERDRKAGEE